MKTVRLLIILALVLAGAGCATQHGPADCAATVDDVTVVNGQVITMKRCTEWVFKPSRYTRDRMNLPRQD